MSTDTIASLTEQVIAGEPLSRAQAERLTEIEKPGLSDLFAGASRIRDHFVGRRVRCCSIVAAKTGRCAEDCAFCSQSARHRTSVGRGDQRETDEVVHAADRAADAGAHSFGIVNSGYAPTEAEIRQWGCAIRRIRDAGRVRTCASLGVLDEDQAHALAAFGLQCYNHNLQTSRRFFTRIVSTHSYDGRLRTLRHLRAAGIRVCSGALFGMGETWADRLDLAFELARLQPEVVPLNFLIPIPGTPLADAEPLDPLVCLQIIAVYRFLLPRQEIKIAGGREVNLRDLQSWIFLAGADSFMIGNYLTTCGRAPEEDLQMLRDLGLELAPAGPDPSRTGDARPHDVLAAHHVR